MGGVAGARHLGLGRFWHFVAVIGWVFTGLIYVFVLFTGEQWRRLVPTSPSVFPEAWMAAVAYLRFDVPPAGHPYNALQQLTYFAVVFVLTAAADRYGLGDVARRLRKVHLDSRLFGGRQAARSLHFIGLVAFVGFVIHHVALVVAHGLLDGLAAIVLGVEAPTPEQRAIAVAIALVFLVALIALHVWATRRSLQEPRAVQDALQRILDPLQARLLQPLTSRQRYQARDITPDPRPNGRPPRNREYVDLLDRGFADWRFEVGGLVRHPLSLTLTELRGLAAEHQITQHKCIQGWSYTAAWQGVPLRVLLDRCQPMPAARYILFPHFRRKWEEPAMASTTTSSISISPVHLKRCSRTT
jgi:thiosulfate reductase cytochrome b subunit